jgi:predicted TIM-barrel fold metal-dependent hydrolase
MIIDSHAHVMLPTEQQIHLMDEAGVGRTILFATTVHPERAADLPGFRQEMRTLQEILAGRKAGAEARVQAHAELLAVIAAYPDRFVGFGSPPLGLDLDQTATWVETEVVGRGLHGLGEFTLAPGSVHLLEPVIAAAALHGNLPLWVHTFFPLGLDDIRQLVDLADRHPTVPLILGHLGGVHWLEAIELASARPHIYLDLSAAFSPLAPKFAVQSLPERTLFSSDAPYGDPVIARQLVERVVPDPVLQRMVLGENAARLLDLHACM